MTKSYHLWTHEEESYLFETLPKEMSATEKASAMSKAFDCDFTMSAVQNKWLRGKRSRHETPIAPPKVDMPTLSIEQMVEALEREGYQLKRDPSPEDRQIHVDTTRFKGKDIRLGIVSDSHLSSRFQQLTHLHTAYRFFAEQGIKHVLHAGDISAGNGKVYAGQIHELFVVGADRQRDYVIEHYPEEKEITTYLIAGNHDLSFMKEDGLDICRAIAERREDIQYLGQYGAYLNFGSLRLYLHHGDGGGAYALSYRLQKLIGAVSPENKPHIWVEGHYHTSFVMPDYRGVLGMHPGAFEAQTPYLKRKGLDPRIGFYTLTVTQNPIDREDGTTHYGVDWYPFYIAKEDDY